MQRRHGARLDAALEAVAHNELNTVAQFGDESVEIAKIIAVVTVSHDYVVTAGSFDAADQGGAVAPRRDVHHARTVRGRDGLRPVCTAVVSAQPLAIDAASGKISARLVD